MTFILTYSFVSFFTYKLAEKFEKFFPKTKEDIPDWGK